MHDESRPEPTSGAAASGAKKLYEPPALRLLGAVHLLTRGTAITANGDAGQNMMSTSERALKQEIVRVGDHPLGIGLYLFTYKAAYAHLGAGRQFGVMADEVEAVLPEAVSRHPQGYRMVDYARLGISRPVQ